MCDIFTQHFLVSRFLISSQVQTTIYCVQCRIYKRKKTPPHTNVEKMSSKESTTTNSSDGGGTHHSSNSYSNHHHTRENRESVSRSLRSSTLPPSDRNNINNSDHRGGVIPLRNKESLFLKESLRHNNKPGGSIPMAQSIRSRSSGDGSSIGSSQSQRPMTVTYKSKTTTGMLFSKKTTSVDCGRFIKEPDGYEINLL